MVAEASNKPPTGPDAFGIFSYVVYALLGGVLVFAFASSLDSAMETQERSVCRALSPEIRSRVHGVVLDASGNPVAGAKINEPGTPDAAGRDPAVRSATSGDDGRFELFVPEGEQPLVVDASGVRFEGAVTVEGPTDLEVEIRLPEAGEGGELVEVARGQLMAPEIEAEDLAGNPIKLSDLRGKFVIVNFWATWCEPCITEWPQFDQLAKRLGARDDVAILAVSIDEDRNLVRPFLERMALLETEVGVVWDPTQEIHRAYGSQMIPDTFFVDEEGRLVHAFVNVRKWGAPEAFHCVDGSAGRG
jgi:thiol-disulfide isomerase/thioredoxin